MFVLYTRFTPISNQIPQFLQLLRQDFPDRFQNLRHFHHSANSTGSTGKTAICRSDKMRTPFLKDP